MDGIGVILAAVCAHSYMMPARPAWDSVLEVLSIVGAACLLGPATCAVVLAAKGEDAGACGLPAVAGSAIGAVCTAAYVAFIQLSAGAFSQVGYYFDPTHPTKAVADAAATVGDQAPAAVARRCGRGRGRPGLAWLRARLRRRGDAAGWKLFRRRGRGRGPHRRGLPACGLLQRGPVRVHVLLGGFVRAWPGRLAWPPLAGQLLRAGFGPPALAPAAGDPLPGGGAEAGPPGGSHRVFGRQPNTLKRPFRLRHPFLKPPCKQGRLQAEGAALRLERERRLAARGERRQVR